MSDEQQRDIEDEATGEPSPARRRFGGLTDRFRRQRPEPTRPSLEDDAFASVEPPVPALRATAPDTSPEPSDPAEMASDDAEAEDSEAPPSEPPASHPEPHPELHPALRAPAAGAPDVAPITGALAEQEHSAPDLPNETSTPPIAASHIEEVSTPTPTPLVAEERIAFTPRPVPPVMPEVAEPADVEPIVALAGGFADEAEEMDDTAIGLRRRTLAISAYLVVLTALATGVILAFVLIEPTPRWLLILGAGAVILGLDGTLRQTWREPFAMGQETAPFLFVPALFMLAVPVLVEHNITGEVVVLAALGAGLAFGTLAWAELASVRAFGVEYPQARTIVTANTYLVGFAIFSLTYAYTIPLPAAILACGIAAAMLAVEVLREGEIDPAETLGLALVVGVVIAEARWLFYYASLDTYLAGLTLLLVFYLVTGLLHSHIVRAFRATVVAQYGGITAAGLALVIVARAAGLA